MVCPPGSPQGSDWQTGKWLSLGFKRTLIGFPPFLLCGQETSLLKASGPRSLKADSYFLASEDTQEDTSGDTQEGLKLQQAGAPTPQLPLASLTPLHMATTNARLKTPSKGQASQLGQLGLNHQSVIQEVSQGKTGLKWEGRKTEQMRGPRGYGGRQEARHLGFKCHA